VRPTLRLTAGALAGALAMSAAAAPAVSAPVASAPAASRSAAATERVPLRTVDASGAREGTRPVADGQSRWRVPAGSLVAVTWRGATAPDLQVRLAGGHWEAWEPMADLGERSAVAGSEALWVGRSDRLWLRAAGTDATARLVVIEPGADPVRRTTSAARPQAPARAARPSRAPKPEIHTRKDWGAKERWRTSRPRYNDQLKQVHIHHTAGSNDYKRSEVRGILRSIYRYHTKTLGWSDIGYNFLVDRFGRAWVGRAGGAAKLVRGAHTLGFNHSSTGIAVIGNFEQKTPRADVVTMLVRLAAWKLDKAGRDPRGRVRVTSKGSDLYPKGKRVRLPVVDGHRDTNQTACPGQLLYDLLPDIRKRAGNRTDRFS
jgi:N-acetylmuramoyl-L-alanine amidase